MKNLNRYLEQHNAFADLFNRPRLTLETTQTRQRVADRLDCDLSPENLTCYADSNSAKSKHYSQGRPLSWQR